MPLTPLKPSDPASEFVPPSSPQPRDTFAWRVLRDVQQALFVVDGHWRLVWANPRAEVFFGLSLAANQGQDLWALFPDTLGTRIEDTYRAALSTEESQRAQIFYPNAQRWFDVRVTPFEDGLLISYNDITRRIRAEHEVARQARNYREITDQLSDIVTRSIVHGDVLWMSPSMTETLGWTLADFAGETLMRVVVEQDRALVVAALEQADQTDGCVDTHARIHHKSGGHRYMAIRGKLVAGPTPESPKELILATRDVTEHRASRRELERALAAAEAATRAKSAFLANMSHEIRTPLHGVIGMTSLLLDTPLQEQQAISVEVIRSSGQALLAVINDVLDISKIEAGALELQPREVDLRRCVEEALDVVTGQATEKGLDLAYIVDPLVPSTVELDPSRLQQVLLNLLGNAVKFTERGEVVVRIGVSRQQPGTCVLHFAVADTGAGIPKDRQVDLFQPFRQLDESYTRKHGGTGLGLSISRRLVELMGGTISVKSVLGAGATFSFTLPALVLPSQGNVRISSPPACLDGLRVLIVDDHKMHRRVLQRLCESWNMKPIAFGSGLEAIEWLSRGTLCELALVDTQLADIDGATLAKQLRALRGDLSIIALGPLDNRARVPEAFAQLTKPIKQTRLYEEIVVQFSARQTTTDKARPRRRMGVLTDVMEGKASDGRKRGLRVLLAEDNDVNQLVGRMMLGRLGVEVDVVGDGHEAVAAVRAQAYDIVLMDLHMPELDGIGATQLIRASTAQQPWIIALTASALEEDRRRCLAAGMNDHLSKPMTRESLQGALTRASEGIAADAES